MFYYNSSSFFYTTSLKVKLSFSHTEHQIKKAVQLSPKRKLNLHTRPRVSALKIHARSRSKAESQRISARSSSAEIHFDTRPSSPTG